MWHHTDILKSLNGPPSYVGNLGNLSGSAWGHLGGHYRLP